MTKLSWKFDCDKIYCSSKIVQKHGTIKQNKKVDLNFQLNFFANKKKESPNFKYQEKKGKDACLLFSSVLNLKTKKQFFYEFYR